MYGQGRFTVQAGRGRCRNPAARAGAHDGPRRRMGASGLRDATGARGGLAFDGIQDAGDNAVGLLDIVENRLVGLKSRGVYETPAGTVLYRAHEMLETLVLDKPTLHEKQKMSQTYANMVYNGEWFTPLRQALDAFANETQKVVTGKVGVKLYKGNIIPTHISSPFSLYDDKLGGFTNVDTYDQKDAIGFIRCFGLPLKTRAYKLGKNTNVKF